MYYSQVYEMVPKFLEGDLLNSENLTLRATRARGGRDSDPIPLIFLRFPAAHRSMSETTIPLSRLDNCVDVSTLVACYVLDQQDPDRLVERLDRAAIGVVSKWRMLAGRLRRNNKVTYTS